MGFRAESDAVRSPKFILRSVELLFAIITFSLVATYNGPSKINFVLFTGITTMLFCLAFIAVYLFGALDNATLALVELTVNGIWWIFWLAAAASLADIVSNINSVGWQLVDANKVKASCAFAWLTWFLWTVSTIFSVKELLGRSSRGPPAASVNTGSAGVAMV